MGVNELLLIVIECRQILVRLSDRQIYSQLIHTIDQQLSQYKRDKSLSRLFTPNKPTSGKNKSLSKKKIFYDSSCQKSPKKTNHLRPKQSFALDLSDTSSANQPIHQSTYSSIQESRVQQILLNNINSRFADQTHTHDHEPDTFESQPYQRVNNSFDQQNIFQSLTKKQQLQTNLNEQAVKKWEIQDFFIIDFNFGSNQYEILPKRQNCHNQPLLLIQNQLYQFQQNISQINPKNSINQFNNHKSIQQSQKYKGSSLNQVQLLKHSSQEQKPAVFPFAQITLQSPKNAHFSQVSSFGRYSMEAQVNSTDSRIIGPQKQLQINSDNKKACHINIEQTYQIRQVIMNLLIHNGTSHIRQIKPTSSMTELLKLTTNPSSKNKTLQHIVIPSFLQMRQKHSDNCNKYTHVIKTYEGISYGMKYFQCERFYVIIERDKMYVEVGNVVKQLIKKAFELRVKVEKEVDNVKAHNIKKYTSEISLIPKQALSKYARSIQTTFSPHKNSAKSISDQTYYLSPYVNLSDPMAQVFLYCQTAMNIKFTIQTYPNSESKSFNLVLILMYFVVFQYKIIFLTTKGYEATVSQVVNALVHMVGNLRYIYPIIMAVLTNHHIEFVNAPIPGIVALWGKQARYKKAVEFMRRKIKEQALESMSSSTYSNQSNSSTTMVVDMNKHEFIDHEFTHKELFLIQNLHSYVKEQSLINKNKNLLNIMNLFFNEHLLKFKEANKIQKDNKENWIQIMRDRLQLTQMYEEYMKYQDSLQKKQGRQT